MTHQINFGMMGVFQNTATVCVQVCISMSLVIAGGNEPLNSLGSSISVVGIHSLTEGSSINDT